MNMDEQAPHVHQLPTNLTAKSGLVDELIILSFFHSGFMHNILTQIYIFVNKKALLYKRAFKDLYQGSYAIYGENIGAVVLP